MAGRQLRTALQYMCGNLRPKGEGALSDAHLLERWVMQRDEVAFELLLRRHGPMVFALCRRLLGRTQDAEDAFQATFLVLVRKAASIQKHAALSSWLYKVAYRVALRARHKFSVPVAAVEPDRLARESKAEEELVWRDLRPLLDEEVHRLPPRYRDVFVLCHLQGKTNEEAARELGCPLGTVLSRLSRAREHLRGQLTRRGITIGTATLTAILAHEAFSAPLPPLLAGLTLKHALLTAGAAMAAGQQIPSTIITLSQGVLNAMFLTKIKIALSLLLVIGLTGVTGSYVALNLNAQETSSGKKEAVDVKEMEKQPGAEQEMHSYVTLKGPETPVQALAFSPDGHTLLWGTDDGTVRLWDGKDVQKFAGHSKAVTGVAFSPDGKLLASSGLDGLIYLRIATNGKLLSKIQQQQPVLVLSFSPNGKEIASGDPTNTVRFWDVPTGKQLGQVKGPDQVTQMLMFSPDGKLLAASKGGNVIKVWDLGSKQSQIFKQSVNSQTIAISPDGRVLAAGHEDGSIALHDLASGKQIQRIKGHTSVVLAVVFSPDGKILASSGKDQTIRLWDLTTGQQVTQGKQDSAISGLAISPDGKQLISGSKDGIVKIWDMATGKQIAATKQKAGGFWAYVDKDSDRLSQLVKELIARKKTNDECIEALFLATLGRFPTQTEVKFAASDLAKAKNRVEAMEDVLHNLTSTKEFTAHLQELQQRGPTAWKVTGYLNLGQKIDQSKSMSSLTFSPKAINFGMIQLGQTISQKVKIEGEKPFRILTCESKGNTAGLKAEWQENKTAQVHTVTITFDATRVGAFNGQVTLQTDHGKNQTVTISVAGSVLAESPSP